MKLTCTKPLNLKTDKGDKVFNPGDIFEADFEEARLFIEQGLLKPVQVSMLKDLSVGCLIEWESPLFGLLSGWVEMIPGDGTVIVTHPVTKELTSIQRGWLKTVDPIV